MLRICELCSGDGLGYDAYAIYHGPCPTCEGSGFSNATAAEAWQAELAERSRRAVDNAAA